MALKQDPSHVGGSGGVLRHLETFTREILLGTEASSLITQGVIHMQEKNLDEDMMGRLIRHDLPSSFKMLQTGSEKKTFVVANQHHHLNSCEIASYRL